MKRKILILAILCMSIHAFAQKDTLFYDKDFELLENNENSLYGRLITRTFSSLYKFVDFKNGKLYQIGYCKQNDLAWDYIKEEKHTEYYKNGKKKREATYSNNIAEGIGREYFSNGKLKYTYVYKEKSKMDSIHQANILLVDAFDSTGIQTVRDGMGKLVEYSEEENKDTINYLKEIGNYVNGEKDSIWIGFKNGFLWYKEEYSVGQLIKGTSYDLHGTAYDYTIFQEKSEFEGGLASLMNFLKQNINYPNKARRNNIQGKLFVRFMIDKSGNLSKVKLLNKVHPLLDDEALRVVNATNGLWSIGKQRGQPTDMHFTLPIAFRLE